MGTGKSGNGLGSTARLLCAGLLSLIILIFAGAGAAQATCTVTGGTLTLSAANTTFGPSTTVTVTFTVGYTVTTDAAGAGQCGNRVIDVNASASGGTWSSGGDCNANVNIPNSSGPTLRTKSCNLTWTAPASPLASYTATATADNSNNSFDIGSSNTLTFNRAGISVTHSGGNTTVTEAGSNDSFDVVLDAAPTADITVAVSSGDTTEGTVSTSSLTFTTANWNVPQTVTVTGVNDDVDDGDINYNVVLNPSGDTAYNAIASTNVPVTTTDNDTRGVTVTESGGSTNVTEGGATDSFTVVLTSEPTATVTISVTPDAQCTLSGASLPLTFTTANWNNAQTVTVTAADDAIVEGAHTCVIITGAAAGGDYAGLAVNDVTANVTDNDTATASIANVTNASEPGTDGTLRVTLDKQSSTSTTVSYTVGGGSTATSGSDYTALTGSVVVPALTSTADITIDVIDDFVDEVGETVIVNLTAATSNASITASGSDTNTIGDNDDRGVTVSETGGTTDVDETGPTNDTFTVVLDSEPTANVTIGVTSDAQCTVTGGSSLTFTAADWSSPQTVTVEAVDDAVDEASPHNCVVTTSNTTATGDYVGVAVADVTANVTDNDTTGVTITPNDSSAEEATPSTAGTVDSFLVRLDSQPTGAVTVTLTNDSQCTVTGSLSFDDTNWNTDQTVTVTPIDDLVVEGAHTCAAASIEANGGGYTAVTATSPTINVTDNDTADLTAVKSAAETSYSAIGEILHYSILVTNTGNVPLTNISIDDPLTGDESCPATTLAPTATMTCTATYMIAAIDIGDGSGSVSNTANIYSDETSTVASNTLTINYQTPGPSIAEVRDAFGSQAYNFMADRAKLMAANGPVQHRLVNRPDGDFQGGSNALNIVGVNGDLTGNFALNSSMSGRHGATNGATIVPTGDGYPEMKFNVWAEGRFSIYDDSSAGSSEGNFFIGYVGADLALTDDVLVGVMTQLDWMDSRIDDGKTDGTGWMVGPYVSAEVARGVFFDARAMWGMSENSIRQEIQGFNYHGDFDTERWLAEAILSGNFEAGAFTLSPDLRFTYIRENQKDYSVTDGNTTVNINGEQVDLGQLSVGLKASHLTELDGANVRAFVAGRLFWDVENPGHLALSGGEVSTDDLRAAVSLGLDVATENSLFGFEATYDGLLNEDLDAIGGRVSWSYQF